MTSGVKALLAASGMLCVGLGVIGIFVPGLPTTPFMLLAAWLFARSSTRLHQWLLNHPRLGPFIKAWNSGAGLERKMRRRILLTLWLGMSVSMLIIAKLCAVLLLSSIGSVVSIYLLRLPVYDNSSDFLTDKN